MQKERTGPVRIGVNASIVGRNPTGLGIYTVKLIQALDRLRDDLVVYASYPEAFSQVRAPVLRVPAATRPDFGFRGHVARLLWLQSTMRLRVRSSGLGMLLNTVPEGIAGLPITQVTVVHDLLPLRFPPQYPRHQHYFRHFVPRILHGSRIVAADSEFTRRDVMDHYAIDLDKVRVVRPGYDPAAFFCNGDTPLGGSMGPYFLYVGNMLPHKNLPRLLEAIAIVRDRRRCRLVIRGEGRPAYVRAVRDRVAALGLGDCVSFVGYLDERHLRDLYTHAACLVLPSLGEGFGLPVVEAMACGTPVIAANISAIPEAAGEAALMADPYDQTSLADAMERVLTDDGLRRRLRRQGLEHVRAFSWRRCAETMSTLLDEALGDRPAAAPAALVTRGVAAAALE